MSKLQARDFGGLLSDTLRDLLAVNDRQAKTLDIQSHHHIVKFINKEVNDSSNVVLNCNIAMQPNMSLGRCALALPLSHRIPYHSLFIISQALSASEWVELIRDLVLNEECQLAAAFR